MTNETSTLIVGIGSAHGDDQIGWRVADDVNALVLESSYISGFVVQKAKSPLDLLNWLGETGDSKIRRLLICDACHALGEPGSVCRWGWPTDELECVRFSGSHDFGLVAVLQLAEGLGRLPPQTTIWGVQIGQVQPGIRMSPPLSHVATQVAREMLQVAEVLKSMTSVDQAAEL